MSKYENPFSIAKRKTITISNDDPRSKNNSSAFLRSGSKINTTNISGKKILESNWVWKLNGSAQQIESNRYRLTTATNGVASSMWWSKPLQLPITATFSWKLTPSGTNLGDGIVFAITNYSNPDTILGGSGGKQGIMESGYRCWGISFDAWRNLGQPSDSDGNIDPLVAALDTNYSVTSGDVGVPLYTSEFIDLPKSNFSGTHRIKITLSNTQSQVWIDDVLVLTTTSYIYGRPNDLIRVGFSGSTGQSIANYELYNISIS